MQTEDGRRWQRKIVPPSASGEGLRTRRKDGPLKAATTLLRRAARAEADAEGGPPADGGFDEGWFIVWHRLPPWFLWFLWLLRFLRCLLLLLLV
jgi:hypothetical protein